MTDRFDTCLAFTVAVRDIACCRCALGRRSGGGGEDAALGSASVAAMFCWGDTEGAGTEASEPAATRSARCHFMPWTTLAPATPTNAIARRYQVRKPRTLMSQDPSTTRPIRYVQVSHGALSARQRFGCLCNSKVTPRPIVLARVASLRAVWGEGDQSVDVSPSADGPCFHQRRRASHDIGFEAHSEASLRTSDI